MHTLRQRLFAHLRFRLAAYLVLLIALVPTGIAYWRALQNVQARDTARFHAVVGKVETIIRDNLEGLTADLLALSGFFEASTTVRRDEWETFVAKLDLERRHPGIRSVGFSEHVTADASAAFLERVRKEAGPDFDIFPRPASSIAFPTVYVTQFPTNIDARLGWDSYSEPLRRAALDSIMESGRPTVTGKARYWNSNGRETEGFTILVPVPARADSASAKMRGAIFSSIIPQQIFNGASRKQFDRTVSVELFDGALAEGSKLLAAFGAGSETRASARSENIAIHLLDHVFLLRITTLPEFETHSEKRLPLAILTCGLAFTFLLVGITWVQGTSRASADKLNRRLRESEEQLRTTNAELERRISEAKRTEDLLAHERDLLGALLEYSPDAVYFKDRESRFIKCGRAVGSHLGLNAAADATGKTDFDFFTHEHARPAFELEQEIIRTGNPVIGLVEKETWHDGHETWVLTSKIPLRDKHGNIVGTFGISKDITKLKAIELALEKEKELLAVTLRSIGDGVITTDVSGRIVLFNQVAERLTGWTQTEAAGRPLKEVFRTSSAETNTEVLRRVLEETEPTPARDSVLVGRDGVERNISQSLGPIIDRDGRKIGAVLVFRDITERLKAEAELFKASKLESIGVLAGGIAHDFNNILTVILGNISLARMSGDAGEAVIDSLIEAENASLRARELTQRLLTFAKGGAPIKKLLDLPPLVRDCAARALQGTDVAPEFFIGDGLWTVEADDSQISQVIQNLIMFARASMSQDPRLDIHVLNQEVSLDPLLLLMPGQYVRVSIRDYGAGIQPENLTKIFEPYFGSKKQGNGLELATAYSIVRKHDGQIRVESIVGKGTIFHVYLPAVVDPAVPAPPAVVLAPRPGKITPRHVLVMDDELPIRKLAVQLLQRIGCTAVTAADGAEAIQLYESARQRGEPFCAVIMDLTVPHGLGGKETIRQLRALDPDVLAIVSSGYSNDPVMANFRDFGFVGVVPKPYNSDDLAAALGELFSRRN